MKTHESNMILLNNGMAKSGSTLLQHYCCDLLSLACPRNGQQHFRDAISSGRLPGVADFMDCPTDATLPVLEEIANSFGPIVVKTHSDVNDFLLQALRDRRFVMVTTYRDPRDMLLSAIDHANRVRGDTDAVFQEFTTVTESIPHARWWANMAIHWIESGLSMAVSYADLLKSPERVILQVAAHWGVPIMEDDICTVVSREREGRRYGINQFNKGELSRWMMELSEEQRTEVTMGLIEQIESLGFSVAPGEEGANHAMQPTR